MSREGLPSIREPKPTDNLQNPSHLLKITVHVLKPQETHTELLATERIRTTFEFLRELSDQLPCLLGVTAEPLTSVHRHSRTGTIENLRFAAPDLQNNFL